MMRPAARPMVLLAFLLCAPLDAAAQLTRLAPPDTSLANHFGSAISMDGGLAVIGAPGSATCGENSGAAFLYSRGSDNRWSLLQPLLPADCETGHFFGKRVAVSDSVVAVVSYRPFFSAATSNTVHIFRPDDDGTWAPVQHLRQPAGDQSGAFGTALSLDQGRLVVTTSGDTAGGTYNGVVHVYEEDTSGHFLLVDTIIPRIPPRIAVSGSDIDLDGDRMTLAASAYTSDRPGVVTVYERTSDGHWSETAAIRGVDAFFPSIDLLGDRIAIGENRGGPNGSGQVRVVERGPDGTWVLRSTLFPRTPFPDGGFGSVVRLGDDRLVAVGYDEQLELDVNIDRIAYVFTAPDAGSESVQWTQSQVIDIGRSSFATAIDMAGHVVFLGQSADDIPGQVWIAVVR